MPASSYSEPISLLRLSFKGKHYLQLSLCCFQWRFSLVHLSSKAIIP